VLSNGTVIKFKEISYDDESNNERVQELYTRLITDGKADILISPYSSGMTASAAIISEQYGKIMITTGAASDSTYTEGYTQVYQIYTPASRYLTGAVDLLKTADPAVKKIAFVYENDKFSADVVSAAKNYAEGLGYSIVLFEGYDSSTTDFAPFINKIQESGAEAVLGGGHYPDGSTFARQVFEKSLAIKFFVLLVAPPEPNFTELGDAALGVIGPSQWEPQVVFTEKSAKEAGKAWHGITSEEFINLYKATYAGETPSYHSAGGYAAGLVLEKAIRDADSTDMAAIKADLDSFDIYTFYGSIQFDKTPQAHGLQIGHSMVYIQWQKDTSGKLISQVVWPAEGASAKLLYPLR
jgi:branched-chain amino acid transport system substrate-binding protein